MDWRGLMKQTTAPPQYPQNHQKGNEKGNSEDIENIEEKIGFPKQLPRGIQETSVPSSPCHKCGSDFWERTGPSAAWQCRSCNPVVRAPGYETLGPKASLGTTRDHRPRNDHDKWLSAWQNIAEITSGLSYGDTRVPALDKTLAVCDQAFEVGDWQAFNLASERVNQIMRGKE